MHEKLRHDESATDNTKEELPDCCGALQGLSQNLSPTASGFFNAMIIFPSCQNVFSGHDDWVGKEVVCPECKKHFIIKYEVKEHLLTGKPWVHFKCGNCRTGFRAELQEAGTEDTCLNCQRTFIIPGSPTDVEFDRRQADSNESRPPNPPRTVWEPWGSEVLLSGR